MNKERMYNQKEYDKIYYLGVWVGLFIGFLVLICANLILWIHFNLKL